VHFPVAFHAFIFIFPAVLNFDVLDWTNGACAVCLPLGVDGDISGTADTGESTSANDGPSLERVVLSMPTRSLRRTLYVMAKNTPRTLEALITHAMTATAAEIITSKFEEGAPSASSEDPEAHPADDDNTFYEAFYSVFGGEPDRALTALVKRKEAFAHEALLALVRDLVTGH